MRNTTRHAIGFFGAGMVLATFVIGMVIVATGSTHAPQHISAVAEVAGAPGAAWRFEPARAHRRDAPGAAMSYAALNLNF